MSATRVAAHRPASVVQLRSQANEKVAEIDRLIEDRFRTHELADIVPGMPGIGPLPGAEFLAAIGDDLTAFGSLDGLAAFAGPAPASHDSGKRNGNLHRPRHCPSCPVLLRRRGADPAA